MSDDCSEQAMLKTFQLECQKMAKDGTLTPERQFTTMMMYLPQSYVEKHLKDSFKQSR